MYKLNIGISGSREYDEAKIEEAFEKKILPLVDLGDIVINVGDAIGGADAVALRIIQKYKIGHRIFCASEKSFSWMKREGLVCYLVANWKTDGKYAGIKRNSFIEKNSDYLIAFWNGESRGCLDTIKKFQKQNKPVTIIYEKEEGDNE